LIRASLRSPPGGVVAGSSGGLRKACVLQHGAGAPARERVDNTVRKSNIRNEHPKARKEQDGEESRADKGAEPPGARLSLLPPRGGDRHRQRQP